jgi:hypothetical protein
VSIGDSAILGGEDSLAFRDAAPSTSFVNESFAALYAPDIVSIIELDADASFVSTSGNELSIGEIVFVDVLISERGSTLPDGLSGIFILSGGVINVSTLPDELGVSTLPDMFIVLGVTVGVSTLPVVFTLSGLVGVSTLPVIDTLSGLVGVSTLLGVIDIFALFVSAEFGVSAPPNMLSKNPPPFIFGFGMR